MAIACAVLVLAITTLSAFIRLARPAPGCQPWPQCQAAQAAPVTAAGAPAGAVGVARIAHRITASAALLLIIGMLMAAFTSTPVLREPGRLVLALLALALFLAVLGRMAADSRAPGVVLGNLLAGFAMFAVSCRLVALLGPHTPGGTPSARVAAPWTWVALVLLVVEVALGALVSATGGAGAAYVVHLVASAVVGAVLLPLGFLAWRRGQGAGAAVIVLTIAAVASGGLLVLASGPLALVLAHNVVSVLLLAALWVLAGRQAAR